MSVFYAAVSSLDFAEGVGRGCQLRALLASLSLHSLFAIFGGITMGMRRSKIMILYDVGVANTYACEMGGSVVCCQAT